MNIYVGNLSAEVTKEDLAKAFEAFGKVSSSQVVYEKFSTISRGFGFVEMPAGNEAKAAITGLNGTELKGRSMVINEAKSGKGKGRGGR